MGPSPTDDVARAFEAARRTFELYPHPTSGVVREIGRLDAARRKRLAAIAAEYAGEDLAELVVEAIGGAVVRNGLGKQEGTGWDPWPHFAFDVVLSSPKLAANVAAARQARQLGWTNARLAYQADSRRPPKRGAAPVLGQQVEAADPVVLKAYTRRYEALRGEGMTAAAAAKQAIKESKQLPADKAVEGALSGLRK